MAPWKCPDCGVWWAGLEHRCDPAQFRTGTNPDPFRPFVPPMDMGGTTTIRCTCPEKRGDNYLGFCPVHDVQVTYTVGWA